MAYTVTDAIDANATHLARAGSGQTAKQGSDANAAQPQLEYDPVTKQRYYDTAPTVLKRLFGSPLAQTGKYATGPNDERLVLTGWSTQHQSIDFAGKQGEFVLAAADGVITFVGYASTDEGAVAQDNATSDDKGTILDVNKNTLAQPAQVGLNGIFVWIRHNGDFNRYKTAYCRLAQANVHEGQSVKEGDAIGTVGGTGGPRGFSGPSDPLYLLFQTFYIAGSVSAAVPPTTMVPNYWPGIGNLDSINSGSLGVPQVLPSAPAGVQAANSQAANMVNGLNRATTQQNQTVQTIKQGHTAYAARVAQVLAVQQSALYISAAAFQGTAPAVLAPMTFDFTAGVWSDGNPV